jgi:hypothetical protein
LSYALDADKGKAVWASTAARADAWTAQYVGTSPVERALNGFYPAWLPFQFLQHDAPALPLAAPQAELLEKSDAADARLLRLRIKSPRGGRAISVEAPENEVLEAWANDRKLGQPPESRWNKHGAWSVQYANPSAEGFELRLRTKGDKPVTLVLVDRSTGLPNVPRETFTPRPDDSVPQHSGDQTMVRRSFVF